MASTPGGPATAHSTTAATVTDADADSRLPGPEPTAMVDGGGNGPRRGAARLP